MKPAPQNKPVSARLLVTYEGYFRNYGNQMATFEASKVFTTHCTPAILGCAPTRHARSLPALLPDLRRYRLLHPVYTLCSLMCFPSTFRCATQCPGITGTFVAAIKLFLLQRTVRAVCFRGALACVACKTSTGASDCLGFRLA